jgi:acetyl-CoA synthetase
VRAKNYGELSQHFSWRIPDSYNIGVDVCDRHANGSGRLALISINDSGHCRRYTFDDLSKLSNRFANALLEHGLQRGDRVGVLLPQAPETAIAHLAVFKVGLVSVPLFTLFGEQALQFRLADSAARAVVTDLVGLGKLIAIRGRLPSLEVIYVVGLDGMSCDSGKGIISFESVIGRGAPTLTSVETGANDPAMIIYTSGTTGSPKGTLHAHRVLLGHLPGVELSHDFLPGPGDLCWTPADWAWIGGLLDVLLSSWHHGVPVLAYRAKKFDPEFAIWLMAEHAVRNVFLPPTALKLMRQVVKPHPRVRLRTIASGGESLGEDLLDWGRATFGVTINEFYGQTECNMVVSNSSRVFPVRSGSMGRAVPGHVVRIVDEAGVELPRGDVGFIAVLRPDPVMFLEYWHSEGSTTQKFIGDYLITGDLARLDPDGYFSFVGRSDDLINSSGYRIGPSEIENCLIGHPSVSMAAVVGVPDPVRTEAIKAWLVLNPGYVPSDGLVHEIQNFVRAHLGAHEYPRLIAFTDALPLTATGKIIRRELRERG